MRQLAAAFAQASLLAVPLEATRATGARASAHAESGSKLPHSRNVHLLTRAVARQFPVRYHSGAPRWKIGLTPTALATSTRHSKSRVGTSKNEVVGCTLSLACDSKMEIPDS